MKKALCTNTLASKACFLALFALIIYTAIPSAKRAEASFFSSLFGATAGASEEVSGVGNAQTTPILIALTGPLGTADKLGESVTIEDDSALSADTGPSGSASDVWSEGPSNGTVSVYVVRPGDTVSIIAKMFGVSENTVRWANDLKKGQALKQGDTLIILPVTGVKYTVRRGDSVSSIAKKFHVDNPEDIISFNNLEDAKSLKVGTSIIVPGADISESEPVVKKGRASIPEIPETSQGSANGYYIKPIPCPLSQGRHDHYAVDLSCHVSGTPVKAAADGIVLIARYGYNGGFGNLIVLKHSNGTQTFYAHLKSGGILVSAGDSVGQGQIIGNVGSTGHSTGPHLHFEVRGAKNPGFDRSGDSWKAQ